MTNKELKAELDKAREQIRTLKNDLVMAGQDIGSLEYQLSIQKDKTTEAIFEAGLLHRIISATLNEISDR